MSEGEIPNIDEITAEILKRFQARREAEAELGLAINEVKACKAKLKAAKDAMDRFLEETQNPLPLFASQNTGVEAEDDEWRDTLIEHVLRGVSGTVILAVKDKGLDTLGKLVDWQADRGGRNQLTDIPCVGAANAEKIADACEAFWARRAERAEKQAAAERETVENLARTGNA